MNFSKMQDEVKRRGVRDQSGTTFDTATKNAINASLLRTAREALWRVLRSSNTLETVTSVDGSASTVSVTNASKTVTISSETLITTNGVGVGRIVGLSGSNLTYRISAISESGGDTVITLDIAYDGTTAANATYSILPQEEYNLPLRASHRLFMWHNDFGYPYKMNYITDQSFRDLGVDDTTEDTPTHYRMWGEDMVEEQPASASILTVSSSNSGDTSIPVTIFGAVAGYPDFETITTNSSNGTTTVNGAKQFSSVDRIVKNGDTDGPITVTSNSALVKVTVIPAGNATDGMLRRKIQLWPLPDRVFPIHAQYYREPLMLSGNNDVHEMGVEFDEAIILLAVAKIKYENSQKEGDRFVSLWKDEIRSLRRTNVDKIDWLPRLQRPNQGMRGDSLVHPHLGLRQLGGNYGKRF